MDANKESRHFIPYPYPSDPAQFILPYSPSSIDASDAHIQFGFESEYSSEEAGKLLELYAPKDLSAEEKKEVVSQLTIGTSELA